jgi:hypothetical protein
VKVQRECAIAESWNERLEDKNRHVNIRKRKRDRDEKHKESMREGEERVTDRGREIFARDRS